MVVSIKMQTFLPFPDLKKSASVLDNKRLNKQIMECRQIVRSLKGQSKGWVNHPMVKAWRGCESLLVRFGIICCDEKLQRTGKDHVFRVELEQNNIEDSSIPWWFGKEEIHGQYRANLLHKNPEWYVKFGWKEIPDSRKFYPLDHKIIFIEK